MAMIGDGLPPIIDNPYRQGKDPSTAQAERARDQQILDHLCGQGCSCMGAMGGADDPLRLLEQRDTEVRQHEQEHFGQAGEFAAGGPVFETVTASNGRAYAVGGHVNVNVAEVAGDPAKTIAKMQQIQRAALAPSAPSDQDRKVAAEARHKETEATTRLHHQELGWNLAGEGKPKKS